MSWTSFHVFLHAGSHAVDGFLLEGVHPLIDRLRRDGAIESWFFIRYWEGGPHVRLRLAGCAPATAARVREALEEYLRRAPRAAAPLDPLAFYRGYTTAADAVAAHGWHEDHEIAAIPYQPEVERYGGAAGLAISEELFCDASHIALALVRLAPEKRKRIAAAAQLMFAMLQAMEIPPVDAVAWIRGNTAVWSQLLDLPPAVVFEAVALGQGDYFANERSWVAASRASGSTLAATWASRVARAMERYRAVEREGRLSIPPLAIMWSQLHMLHNRLGLSIPDECVVSSLVSIALARGGERAPYLPDSIEALDRRYHEHSKYTPQLLEEQRPAEVAAPDAIADPAARWSRREPVALPRATLGPDRVGALAEVLRARRSRYDGYQALSAAELGTLLELAVGRSSRADRRTYPSGGGRYPVQTYVLVNRVEGIPPALYLHDAERNALRWVSAPPAKETLVRCSPHLSGEAAGRPAPPLSLAADAPAWVFPVADFGHQRKKYGLRAYRLVLLECGHLAQNLCLVATALGLSSITVGAFFDDLLNQMLSLDGVNRSALYMIPFGRPSP
jgi:thiopeptide-type bacteriocin biosynthesis protein